MKIKKDYEFDPESYVNDTSAHYYVLIAMNYAFIVVENTSWQIRWLFFYA